MKGGEKAAIASFPDGCLGFFAGVAQSSRAERARLAAIQRAIYTDGLTSDMGVDHGRLDPGMTEEFLDGANVISVFEEMRSEGVPQGMAGCALGEVDLPDGLLDCFLNSRRGAMVPPKGAGVRIR